MDRLQQNCFDAGAPVAATTSTVPPPPPVAQKKRRRQEITDDDNVEVIALSAEEINAKTMFHCELCNKGFQREQNLILHQRAHNLPYALNRRPDQNILDEKRKVYLCPERSCLNHIRSKALGDLASLKKHFKRKHGEKTMKCDKCSKKYAVEGDLQAHLKICGANDCNCVCGRVFSRRDTYKTHIRLCRYAIQAQQLSSLVSSEIGSSSRLTNVGKISVPTISISDPNNQPAFNSNTTASAYSFPFLSDTILAPPLSNLSSSNESVHRNMMTTTANISSTQGSDLTDNTFDINVLYDRLFGVSSVPAATALPQEAPQQRPSLANLGTSDSFFRSLGTSTAAGSVASDFAANAFNVYPNFSSTGSGDSYLPVMESVGGTGTYENPDHLRYRGNDISENVFNLQGEAMQRDPLQFGNSQMGDYWSTRTVNENMFSTPEDVVTQNVAPSGLGIDQINQEQLGGFTVGGDANLPVIQNDFQFWENWLGN